MLDEYDIDYEQLRDADARAGRLRERFDAIILPDASPSRMIEGHAEGTMPREYAGGLGEAGVRGLEQFVREGGTLIAFNRASLLPIKEFGLPVREVLSDLDRSQFYIPGSILRLELEPGHWLAEGVPTRSIAWFEEGLAFEAETSESGAVEIVGRYGGDETLLSGWITGEEHIAGRGALAVVHRGQGRIVLFGFRPQYRAQTIATYPLLFNAVKRAANPMGTSGRDDRAREDR